MPRMMQKFVLAGLLGAGLSLSAPVSANEADAVSYSIERGDTLYSIARRYLIEGASVERLRRANGVEKPRQLQIGSTLSIPRELLRFEQVDLKVAAFSGPVRIAGSVPSKDDILRDGQRIETGANGFVTFTSTFGGRISLPSNTSARLVFARRYVFGNALDVDFEITRGRVNVRSPSLEGDGRLRMRTPLAVTAVRGTEFRVAFDPERGDVSLTEVTEGAVNVLAGAETSDALAGFGLASSADGVGEPEKLLPAPILSNHGEVQTDETLTFTLDPVEDAQGYRVQVARTTAFIDILGEEIVDGTTVTMPGIENGRYIMRARAISASGLEGKSEGFGFLRKRLSSEATVEGGADFDGYKFAWVPTGGEQATFAFQLWSDADAETLIVDQAGLAVTELTLTDMAPGKYFWRVAIVETDPQAGLIKVWGPTETLNVSE